MGVTGLAAAGEGGVWGPPAASSTEPSWNLTPLFEPPAVMAAYVEAADRLRVASRVRQRLECNRCLSGGTAPLEPQPLAL